MGLVLQQWRMLGWWTSHDEWWDLWRQLGFYPFCHCLVGSVAKIHLQCTNLFDLSTWKRCGYVGGSLSIQATYRMVRNQGSVAHCFGHVTFLKMLILIANASEHWKQMWKRKYFFLCGRIHRSESIQVYLRQLWHCCSSAWLLPLPEISRATRPGSMAKLSCRMNAEWKQLFSRPSSTVKHPGWLVLPGTVWETPETQAADFPWSMLPAIPIP